MNKFSMAFALVIMLCFSAAATATAHDADDYVEQKKKEKIILEKTVKAIEDALKEKAEKEAIEKARLEAEARAEEEKRLAAEAEEKRVNRIDLPLRDSFWISSEWYSVESIRGYSPHTGLDFAIGSGYNIYPVAKGEVVFAGWGWPWEGCGYWTAVRHHQLEVDTIYCHQNSQPPVAVGDWVDPDDVIGYVGSTGLSSGPHLHFGVYPWSSGGWNGGSTIDPRDWLAAHGLSV